MEFDIAGDKLTNYLIQLFAKDHDSSSAASIKRKQFLKYTEMKERLCDISINIEGKKGNTILSGKKEYFKRK
jgi:hypothetical protein